MLLEKLAETLPPQAQKHAIRALDRLRRKSPWRIKDYMRDIKSVADERGFSDQRKSHILQELGS